MVPHIFQGEWRGGKLNDNHYLIILVKLGMHFFKLQGGVSEAKSKPVSIDGFSGACF